MRVRGRFGLRVVGRRAIDDGMKRALVIEGGGLRGAFTAGAGEQLAVNGVVFDEIVACSAGAPTAAYMVTGQPVIGAAIWCDYIHGDQLVAFGNVVRGLPFMDVDRLVRVFRDVVPLNVAAIDASPTQVRVAVTCCRTGAPKYVRMTTDNAFELMRATMALPVAYGKTVDVDGVPCVDGGLGAPVPLDPVADCDEIVVLSTKPRGYRRVHGPVTSFLLGATYPRHPALRRAFATRAARANEVLDRIDALEAEGRVRVIRPEAPLPVGRIGRDRAAIVATLEAGRAAAHAFLAAKRAAA